MSSDTPSSQDSVVRSSPLSTIDLEDVEPKQQRSRTPNPSSKNSLSLDEDYEVSEIRIKRPRTPSSVPPIPVSKSSLTNLSTKAVKSTESLNTQHTKISNLSEFMTKHLTAKQLDLNEDSASSDRNIKEVGSASNDHPQQFCLKWNSYQNNLKSEFDQLLQNESFVDVTLACDGQSIKAHKMVLSACSPYFQALFFDNPCQHPIIIMKEVKWPELKAVVEYMYKGEINVCQDQIEPLLRVAQMLKIRGLADVDQYMGGGASSSTSPPSATAASKSDLKSGPKKVSQPSLSKTDLQASSAKSGFNDPNARKSFKNSREFVDINESLGRGYSRKNDDKNNNNDVVRGVLGDGQINVGVNSQINLAKHDQLELDSTTSQSHQQSSRAQTARKRRWLSGGDGNSGMSSNASPGSEAIQSNRTNTPENVENIRGSPSALLSLQNANSMQSSHQSLSYPPIPLTHPQPTIDSMGLASLGLANTEDMEIKPGIAEMIREEERVSSCFLFCIKI